MRAKPRITMKQPKRGKLTTSHTGTPLATNQCGAKTIGTENSIPGRGTTTMWRALTPGKANRKTSKDTAPLLLVRGTEPATEKNKRGLGPGSMAGESAPTRATLTKVSKQFEKKNGKALRNVFKYINEG